MHRIKWSHKYRTEMHGSTGTGTGAGGGPVPVPVPVVLLCHNSLHLTLDTYCLLYGVALASRSWSLNELEGFGSHFLYCLDTYFILHTCDSLNGLEGWNHI